MRPVCPKCGCPARGAWVTARVLCAVMPDGSIGAIEEAGDPVVEPQDVEFVCGGGHKWADPKAAEEGSR